MIHIEALNKTPAEKFTLSISMEVTLSIDEIWPDGNAPANPTPEDVAELIKKEVSVGSLIGDWNLDDDVELTVR